MIDRAWFHSTHFTQFHTHFTVSHIFFTAFDDVKRRTSFHMVFTWWFHIIFHRCVKLYVKNQMKISHVLHMHFTSFLPVVFVSQGFSTAWVILHQGLFHSFLNEHVVLNQLMEILCVTIPGQQPRWYKGVASVLFTHVLVGNILRIYLT